MELKNYKMKKQDHFLESVQCVLDFGGVYHLSVIKGHDTGSETAPYEIAVFKDGDLVRMPGITSERSEVKNYLTESDVNLIIKKMVCLTGEVPEQIQS